MPPNPPKPSRSAAGEVRRDEIISHAIDVFGEFGFAGGRIDDVARRVGLRRPSILYHFPDKSALYDAAISDVLSELERQLGAARAAPEERLEAIADVWVDFVIARPNAARLLLRQMIDADPTPVPSAAVPTLKLIQTIQSAIEEHAGPVAAKSPDAVEFSLVLASTSLVWAASRSAVEGALGLDTLSPTSVQRHRATLHSLTRQLLRASQVDSVLLRDVAESPRSITTDKVKR